MKFSLRTSGVLLVFVFLGSLLAFAQEGTLLGTVTDPSGATVPNVAVTITNIETGTVTHIATNDTGQYVAPDLHIGHYNVQAKGANFKLGEQKDIVLQVGDRRRVDFALQLGNTQETITVEANAVEVQADNGEISGVVTGQQVTQLATNGRSLYALESLMPGASSIQADFAFPLSAGGDANVSFNGLREGHNLWLIDGGEASDRGGAGGSDVMPSVDAVAEFRTMTSNYSAEYGLSSAATMSMAVKSGTRQLHASAWYFGRNDALDARPYFTPAPANVPELRFHTFGFNVGGPVTLHPKSSNPKTFFFYNMEWRRLIQGSILTQTVPLASTYGGNFSGTTVTPHTPCASQLSPTLAAQFASAGQTLSTCDSTGAVTTAVPFTNNTIPTGLLDPNAQALLSAGIFPKPTQGNQFIGGNNSPTNLKEEIARIDHQFNDKFSVFGHWISEQALQTYGTTQWSGDNVPSVFNTFGNPAYHAVVHATYVIHPNLLNETAFNYNGNRIHILPAGVYQAPSGFTELDNRIFGGVNPSNRIPEIHLSGSTGTDYTANWVPWNNSADDYQVRDDISWTKGSHQFKFGASWALYKKVQDYFATTQGSFQFNGLYTGNDFADFLLGYAQQYQEYAVKNAGYWNNISPAAYIQDNWRATHRLTLNLGLRWDGIPHTYEANNRMSNFYPNLYNPAMAPIWAPNTNDSQIAPNSPGLGTSPVSNLAGYQFYLNGIGLEDKNGVPKGLVGDTWNAFGPRVGFAYDVTGHGKTVIRGGFGTMYERIQGNDMYDAATNSPWDYNLSTNNVLLSNPHNVVGGGAITVPIVPASITGFNKAYKAPTSYQFSAGVQQQLSSNAVLSVSYVGNQNRYQNYYQETDLAPLGSLAALQAGTSTIPYNGMVAYQGYHSVKLAFDGANSHYNSLQAEIHGHVTRDLYLQGAYTLSRAIDSTTGNGNSFDLDNVSNPYLGWQYDQGPSAFDRTDVAFVNFVYDIPFLKNSSNHLLKTTVGGWELSGIVNMQTGAPINLGVSGQSVTSIVPNSSNRPDLVGSISYPKGATTLSGPGSVQTLQWFNTSAFAAPAPGTWGNLGHDALRAPGRDNWNLALFKEFVISQERGSRFEFRAESFNTWNHTEFGGPGQGGGVSTNLGSSTFGKVTSAWDPRTFQLGAKLIF